MKKIEEKYIVIFSLLKVLTVIFVPVRAIFRGSAREDWGRDHSVLYIGRDLENLKN